MFLGVMMYCLLPNDIFSCRMIARTNSLFVSMEECQTTVQEEMIELSERLQVYSRAKCFEIGKSI